MASGQRISKMLATLKEISSVKPSRGSVDVMFTRLGKVHTERTSCHAHMPCAPRLASPFSESKRAQARCLKRNWDEGLGFACGGYKPMVHKDSHLQSTLKPLYGSC